MFSRFSFIPQKLRRTIQSTGGLRRFFTTTYIRSYRFTNRNMSTSPKRLAVGISSLAIAGAGVYIGVKTFRNRQTCHESSIITAEEVKEFIPPEIPKVAVENDKDYLPWWTGVKEIAIYVNEANARAIDNHFISLFPNKYDFFLLIYLLY